MPEVLGVLGGMGPLATVDFLRKLIEETRAARDEDHVPVIVYSVPQIPDRPRAITANGESPLPALLEGVRTLERAGAVAIAIPCNTAHYWYDEMQRETDAPILHIAEAALAQLKPSHGGDNSIGLVATRGTLAAGFFQERLAAHGYRCILNTPADQEELVLPTIEHVKRNELARAAALLEAVIARLVAGGASGVVLACTELPLLIERLTPALAALCIDPTRG